VKHALDMDERVIGGGGIAGPVEHALTTDERVILGGDIA